MTTDQRDSTAQKKEHFKQVSEVGELFYIEDYEDTNLTREDIEKWPVEDIEAAIWWSENGFVSYLDDEMRKHKRQKEEKIIERIFDYYEKRELTGIINDFLKVKYFGSFEEIVAFTEKFQIQEVKVSFYKQFFESLQRLSFANNEDNCRKFLKKIEEAISQNDNVFQNIELCENILLQTDRKDSLSTEYFAEEQRELRDILLKNIDKVRDLSKPIENYKGISSFYATNEVIRRLLVDLGDKDRIFSREEIVKIINAVKGAKKICKIVKGDKKQKGNFEKRDEEMLYNLGSYDIDNLPLSELVDLIDTRAKGFDLQEDKDFIDYLNIRLAGYLGYTDFVRLHVGDFYERFDENQEKYTLEGRSELLRYVSRASSVISFDISRNLLKELKEKQSFRSPNIKGRSAFDSFSVYNDDVLENMIQGMSENFDLFTQFLRHCYIDSAGTFDKISRRSMWELENAEDFFKKLKEEKDLPEDIYCSLLINLSLKQLQDGEIEKFKKGIEEVEKLIENIDFKNASLLLCYSISEAIPVLDMFVYEEINYPKKFYTDNIFKYESEGRDKEQRKSFALYLNEKSSNLLGNFGRFLENEKILEEMDLQERGIFFKTVTQNLLSHPSRMVIDRVLGVLKNSFNKEIHYFKLHPEEMSSDYDKFRYTQECLNQLFVDTEITDYLKLKMNSLYKLDKNGEILVSEYGTPQINTNAREIRWPFRGLSDVKQLAKEYAEFLVEMITKHRNYNKVTLLDAELKMETYFCLDCKNREILLFHYELGTRYLLTILLNRYFEKILKRKII